MMVWTAWRKTARPPPTLNSGRSRINTGAATKSGMARLRPVTDPSRYPSGVISPAVVHPITGTGANAAFSAAAKAGRSRSEDMKTTTNTMAG